jgi:uroporphyrinogen-III synthase
MSFAGKRVLSFETRRAHETAELIRRNGGEPFVAPSMRELPIEANEEAFRFAERLFAGEFDMVIFLSGVGARYLARAIAAKWPEDAFPEALRKVTVVARGPKPVAVLREMNVRATVTVPEPNTWRELVAAIEGRHERQIAVQLYGKPHPELVDALQQRGAEVTTVPVYAWGLPEDTGPLREAATRLVGGDFDVTMFTTSNQLVNLLEVAREMGAEDAVLKAVNRTVVASIGPTTSETLTEYGVRVDMEPSHPKLGILVKEAASWSPNA